jgi:hypothetical protein
MTARKPMDENEQEKNENLDLHFCFFFALRWLTQGQGLLECLGAM